MTEQASADLSGRVMSRYRVLERLGAGGMGEVYRARDEKLGRDVALKVLPEGLLADDEARRRFRKEADALSRLSHPHVATLLDFDTADGLDFLVMELVTGPSPADELRHGPLPEREVVRVGASSRAACRPPTSGCRAPRPQAREPAADPGRAVDARTDLYSAGAVLYELATTRRPHGDRAGVELFDAILHREVEPPGSVNESLSPGLDAVIVKLLDKDPELRCQTARELVVDLERLRESMCYSLDRRRPEVLATVGLPLLVVANVPAMFLDPDDDPIVVVDRSVRDIYALEWDVP
jgi:eukaryotic-like serine/threonine-protein kinase